MVWAMKGWKPTVFGEQVIGPAYDELGNKVSQLLELGFTLSFDFVAGHCIATADDGMLKVLAEVILGPQEIGVGEIEEREIL